MNKLTKKQEIFAREYVKLDDASAAYRIAYSTSNMKDKTVHEKASRALKHDKVRARIEKLQSIAAEIAEKEFKTDSTELLRHLTILRKSRIDEYVDFVEYEKHFFNKETGEDDIKIVRELQFKPFDQLTEEQLMCIESVKQNRYGEIELKLHGKDWTIEKIAKHIGFYEKDNNQKKTDNVVMFKLPDNGRNNEQ